MRRIWEFAILLACLCGSGCALSPAPPSPPPSPTKTHLEYRQLINTDAAAVAKLAAKFNEVVADADENTNTLIVKGPAEQVAMAIDLANRLEAAGPDEPLEVVFVRRLKNANAGELASELQQMSDQGFFGASPSRPSVLTVPRPQFVVDARANAIVVLASRFSEERIRGIIDELDRPLNPATQIQPDLRLEQGRLVPRTVE